MDRIQVVLDARRGRVHSGVVERVGDRVRLVGEPHAVDLDEFRATAPVLADPQLVDTLHGFDGRPATPLEEPTAEWLFDPGLSPRGAAPDDLEPLYLMGTYADD